MKEKWVLTMKRADFRAIGRQFGIDQVIARVIRNRDLITSEEIRQYLYGGIEDLYDPKLMKDMEKGVRIILNKCREGKRIRIIGDYDADGVTSTYILLKGLRRIGALADAVIPDRVLDGYGLNEHLVTNAKMEGADTILTCDNGISAVDQIRLAKELGLTVVVTDHHDIPFAEEAGERREILPPADAVINPHQKDCGYPFSGLCGAGVAWKFIQVLYEMAGIPVSEAEEFLEFVGFATVADVMDLTGENRILVKLGLERLNRTDNQGMKALILQKNLELGSINAGKIGFQLAPCLNASGRLEHANMSLNLLLEEDPVKAAAMAEELVELNERRKQLTLEATNEAKAIIEAEHMDRDKVMVVFLPDCHESLAGIVAGNLRKEYYRPVFVVTRGGGAVKGSGRSIEEYSMYEEMNACKELFSNFGGHPMAAGFSLPGEEDIPLMRSRLNEQSTLTEEDLIPKVHIDVDMPVEYITKELVEQLKLLEPFGKGNPKPVFAERNLIIRSLRCAGKDGQTVQLSFRTDSGRWINAVYFGGLENLRLSLEEKYGKVVADDTLAGRCKHNASLIFTYYPELNDYYDPPRLKIIITGCSA